MGYRMPARGLSTGPRPRARFAAVSAVMNLDQIAGVAHQPAGPPHGVVVLTHGAGGSRESTLLQQVCAEWTRRGWLAVRYNLPYRRRRPTGPPSGSGSGDRAGIVEAIQLCRGLAEGPLIAGDIPTAVGRRPWWWRPGRHRSTC